MRLSVVFKKVSSKSMESPKQTVSALKTNIKSIDKMPARHVKSVIHNNIGILFLNSQQIQMRMDVQQLFRNTEKTYQSIYPPEPYQTSRPHNGECESSPDQREFQESPNKIDNYRIFTDVSRVKKGIIPENLNFDLRQLNPGQYSAPYHFHRYAEELFMIVSGSAKLRTPDGLEVVKSGDLIFFEKGERGAHQLYNHTTEVCIYLDIRTYIGYDIAEYPDSDKILLAPTFETFNKDSQVNYFDGEVNIKDKWKQVEKEKK